MSPNIIFSDEVINKKLRFLEDKKSYGKYWNISWEQGDFLCVFVLDKKPKRILELGTSNGFSLMWMLKGIGAAGYADEADIHTVDTDHERLDEAKRNLNTVSRMKINFHEKEIMDFINTDVVSGKFDFIFLDAMQRSYKEIVELFIEKGIVGEGTYVIADNVVSHGNMGEFIGFMNERFETDIVRLGGGLLVARFAGTRV